MRKWLADGSILLIEHHSIRVPIPASHSQLRHHSEALPCELRKKTDGRSLLTTLEGLIAAHPHLRDTRLKHVILLGKLAICMTRNKHEGTGMLATSMAPSGHCRQATDKDNKQRNVLVKEHQSNRSSAEYPIPPCQRSPSLNSHSALPTHPSALMHLQSHTDQPITDPHRSQLPPPAY